MNPTILNYEFNGQDEPILNILLNRFVKPKLHWIDYEMVMYYAW